MTTTTKNFYFKIALTPHYVYKPVNMEWTMAEFLQNMKLILRQHFQNQNQLSNTIEKIHIIDNIDKSVNENIRSPVFPSSISFHEYYRKDLDYLAFYIRPVPIS